MTEIILKQDIDKSRLDALILFLKSWNYDAEVKTKKVQKARSKNDFTLSVGLWKNYTIDAKELRNKAWSRNKCYFAIQTFLLKFTVATMQ